jgi:hypothetical protein
MKIEVEGIEVEVEGVDREELPSAFDFNQMWELACQGESVESMERYVQAQRWGESSRPTIFWNEWCKTESHNG